MKLIIMSTIDGAQKRSELLYKIFNPWIRKIEDIGQRASLACHMSYMQLFTRDVQDYVGLVSRYLEDPNNKELKDELLVATAMLNRAAVLSPDKDANAC